MHIEKYDPRDPNYEDSGAMLTGCEFVFPLAGLGLPCAEAVRYRIWDAELLPAIDKYTNRPPVNLGIDFLSAKVRGFDLRALYEIVED